MMQLINKATSLGWMKFFSNDKTIIYNYSREIKEMTDPARFVNNLQVIYI